MPLSEYEQRVLEQMEQQLSSDDPKLVTTMAGGSVPHVRRWLITGAGALVGLAVMVVGAVASQPVVGVLGFVTMFACVLLAFSSPRRRGPQGVVGTDGSVRPARSASLTERMEKRWDRRRDEQGR